MSLALSRRRLFAVLLTLLLLPTLLHAADPSTFTVGGLTFKRPDPWKWVPINSQFRKAQLHVPDPTNPAGPGADVVFFNFGVGQGGDVDGNISRWVGQFAKPDGGEVKPVVEAASIKGTKVTRVRVDSGTFNSGMPGGPTTPMDRLRSLRRDHRGAAGQCVRQDDRPGGHRAGGGEELRGAGAESVLARHPIEPWRTGTGSRRGGQAFCRHPGRFTCCLQACVVIGLGAVVHGTVDRCARCSAAPDRRRSRRRWNSLTSKMLIHALKLHADEHEGKFPTAISEIEWRQNLPAMKWAGLPAAVSRFHNPESGTR